MSDRRSGCIATHIHTQSQTNTHTHTHAHMRTCTHTQHGHNTHTHTNARTHTHANTHSSTRNTHATTVTAREKKRRRGRDSAGGGRKVPAARSGESTEGSGGACAQAQGIQGKSAQMETDRRLGSPAPFSLLVQVHCRWTGTRPLASRLQASDSRLWPALCASPSRARVQASQRREEEAATMQEHAEEYRQVASDKAKAAALARASAKREAQRRAALRTQVSHGGLWLSG